MPSFRKISNQLARLLLGMSFLFLVLVASYQMLSIIFPYLLPPFPTDIYFLAAKQAVIDFLPWRLAFYIHITSATLVLLLGLTQFSKSILQKAPQLHRRLGQLYISLILILAAPSGFLMGFYGSGGPWAQLAFVLQAIVWWGLSFWAYQTIRRKEVQAHARFMVRSYAMTLSAISLRGATFLAASWKMQHGIFCPNPAYSWLCYPDFYILIAWLSWIVNLLLAEVALKVGLLRYYFPKQATSIS